ncbi:px serine/threonine kinase pxk [Holotrichia oblita]|uniref:Px serine/threonine kinase pxk n=1 Tax=Holotrichia oblita TaxID=644536 RepID=A0ACB9TWX4_HOLOL|nr:px serine/threonine kinase pxk [Holotrichia oblita]
MTEQVKNRLFTTFTNLKIEDAIEDPLSNNNHIDDCEAADETITTDSEEYLSEPLRYQRFNLSTSTNMSNETLKEIDISENDRFFSCNGNIDTGNIQVPIVGYEIMEERARFTVFKLRVENKSTGDCWYVFRRYTDFVRLCNRLKHTHSKIIQHLPRKRWLGNNFDPLFLEDRVSKLQTLVNYMLSDTELVNSHELQEFFCLTDPPMYSETSEESRAMFEGLEETIYHLKQQILEKEQTIDHLHDSLRQKSIETDNLRKLIKNPLICDKCQNEINVENNDQ